MVEASNNVTGGANMEQYTAGQLAELAGVSSRTVRYYDQRGIMHPSGYSEGGYRLYDKDALIKMQQIMMLKFAGFSLEEIQSAMVMAEDQPLLETLVDQLQLMIQKKDQINEIIRLLEDVLEQGEEDVAALIESMRLIKSVNHSGRTYQFLEAHGQRPLYPFEFTALQLQKNMKVLDAGCGYGLLWRQNFERIPEGLEVTMMDVYPAVLDRFSEFYDACGHRMALNTAFHIVEQDVEMMDTQQKYDRIVLAYVFKYLKHPDLTLNAMYQSLKKGGFLLAVQGDYRIMDDYDEIFHAFSGYYCLTERKEKIMEDQALFREQLNKTFDSVEQIPFENDVVFDKPLDLYRFMMDSYSELSFEIKKHGLSFVNFLRKYMRQRGRVKLHSVVHLYRCRKEN